MKTSKTEAKAVQEVKVVTEEQEEMLFDEMSKVEGISEDALNVMVLDAKKSLVGMTVPELRKRGKALATGIIPEQEKQLLSPIISKDFAGILNTFIARYKVELKLIAEMVKTERAARTEGYIKNLVEVDIDFNNLSTYEGHMFTVHEGQLKEIPLVLKNKLNQDCPLKLHWSGMRAKSDEVTEELDEAEEKTGTEG